MIFWIISITIAIILVMVIFRYFLGREKYDIWDDVRSQKRGGCAKFVKSLFGC